MGEVGVALAEDVEAEGAWYGRCATSHTAGLGQACLDIQAEREAHRVRGPQVVEDLHLDDEVLILVGKRSSRKREAE